MHAEEGKRGKKKKKMRFFLLWPASSFRSVKGSFTDLTPKDDLEKRSMGERGGGRILPFFLFFQLNIFTQSYFFLPQKLNIFQERESSAESGELTKRLIPDHNA